MSEQPESEQPEARARVLAVLRAAGPTGLLSNELCDLAKTNAAVRRVWELVSFYGYTIIGLKLGRNCWRWNYVGASSWAVDPNVSVREAKRLKLAAMSTVPTTPRAEPVPLSLFGQGVGL